jgi:hypothetical protein
MKCSTKAYVARAKVVTRERVDFLRTDGGGDYDSTELNVYLIKRGIHHEKTNADTPPVRATLLTQGENST